MTQQVEAWYRERYLSKVTHHYKNGGFLLKNYVMPPAEMDGKTLYFPVAGGGVAGEAKRGDTVKPMNAPREMPSVTAKWYEAPDYVYKMDINKTSPVELEVISKNAADALGQRHDGVIMGALNALAGQYTLASTGAVGSIGTGATAWDPAFALNAETELMRKTETTKDYAVCILPVSVFSRMMTYPVFANSQYVGSTPLAQGVQARTWGQTHYVKGYDAMFARTGNDVTFYYFMANAIGSGDGGGIKTDINYVPEKRAWLHDNMIEIGAKVLLSTAVVECHANINAAITIP